jgi:pantoate--beta-alanine ligase
MRLIRTARQMAEVATRRSRAGERIGVVPTMGALHEGHLSLIRRAAAENDVVIVTVFVNPLQFGPREDYARYPRRLARDARLARAAGADIVFAPSVRQLYPAGFQTTVEPGALARRWEGAARPGHFRGVATVVTILFQLTRPTTAYVGQKDYQQARVVERLIRDVQLPIRLRVLPIVRESDGLAMSSRNVELTAEERRRATVLCRALRSARARIMSGERRAAVVLGDIRRMIRAIPGVRLDYAAVVDAGTLSPCRRLRGRVAILLAAWVGRTRLIDNALVEVP